MSRQEALKIEFPLCTCIVLSFLSFEKVQQLFSDYADFFLINLPLSTQVCMSLLCVYVLYHTVFILGLYWYACAKRREMRELDKEYLLKKAKLEASRRGTEDIFGNLYQ